MPASKHTMYETFFELNDRPFSAGPRTHRYYPAAAIEDVRVRVARAIQRGEGPSLVVGPTGCGKTMLCHVLAEQFRQSFAIAHLEAARICSRRALHQAILFELGLPYRNMAEGELRLSLIDYLSSLEACRGGMLLILDEAHTLPLLLLDEIRMMTNLVRDAQPRARAVLVGSPALEEHFASPKLESFNQRLAARGYLHALEKGETFEYVRAQLAASDGQPDTIFTDSALEAIYRATDGIPRLVNQVSDYALLLAARDAIRPLEAAHIEHAWADLQQLPTPWSSGERSSEEPSDASADDANVIEFGSLDSMADETFDELGTDEPISTISADFGSADFVGADSGSDDLEAVPFRAPGDAEPVARIDEIAEHLSNIDEGLQPDARNRSPFEEEFAEEEVVIDHYATLEDAGLKRQAPVIEGEGPSLAQALDAAQCNLQTATTSDFHDLPAAIDIVFEASSEITAIETPAALSPAASDPIMPEEHFAATNCSHSEREMAAVHPALDVAATTATVGNRIDDILIIEDEPSEPSPAVSGVRRQEYSQLFAQLRRG